MRAAKASASAVDPRQPEIKHRFIIVLPVCVRHFAVNRRPPRQAEGESTPLPLHAGLAIMRSPRDIA
jgi:hypothetical protein